MVTSSHLLSVAWQLKKELDETGKAFHTKRRVEITELVRVISGESNTRVKTSMGRDLERQLLNQGVRVYPSLVETTTGDLVRLFHVGTVVASLVDMLANPGDDTDKQLANVTKKVKGFWEWDRQT